MELPEEERMELPEEERATLEEEPMLLPVEEPDWMPEERETPRPDEEAAVARVVARLTSVAEVRLPEAGRLTAVPRVVLVTAEPEVEEPWRALRDTDEAPPTARVLLL